MAKKTQKARIEELETAISLIKKKISHGLKGQIRRADRDPISVSLRIGDTILEICKEVMEKE